MSGVPCIPENAPFSPDQRAWLNGFFAGLFSAHGAPQGAVQKTAPMVPLTILYGTQTGTAEGLAKKAAKEAGRRGFAATVLDMAATDLAKLAGEKNLLVITSTYGDGEPPDSGKELHSALKADDAPSMAGVNFSVCGLGDTNYTLFCQCGIDFDAFLEKRGAKRVSARVDCDLDYDEPFAKWLDTSLTALSAVSGSGAPSPTEAVAKQPDNTSENESMATGTYTRKNPFPAPVTDIYCLNGEGSAKEVNHIVLSLEGSDLTYDAGDALGVLPHNDPGLVEEILKTLGFDGEEAVSSPDGHEVPLRRALTEFYDLGPINKKLEALLNPVQAGGSAPTPEASTSAEPLHVVDALIASGTKPAAAEFVATLRKLQPRLYSIASSIKAHPGEVHLTVGAVRYQTHGRQRLGVCSTYLGDRVQTGESQVGVFVHHNKAFKLPADGNVPVIMVGPGTGIAPFRSFLEERKATAAPGKNWLIFGDQHEATDFLYKDELLAMKEAGLLTRLDLAWSRDQEKKVYVQDRMLEAAEELYAWLEAGAHFYVCGDAKRMAKDVDAALHTIIETVGRKPPEVAAAYVKDLKAHKRYARDVY